jgi:CheY-like chemotaxis protein
MDEWIKTLLPTLLTPIWIWLGVITAWGLRNKIRDIVSTTGLRTVEIPGITTLGFDPESFAKKTYHKQKMSDPSPEDIADIRKIATLAQLLKPILAGRRILWVDNHPENNQLERQALVGWGVDVQTRRTTEEAMTELYSEKDIPFDLVISDWFRGGKEEGQRLMESMHSEKIDVPILFYFTAPPDLFSRIQAEARKHHAVGATSSPRELLRWTFAELVRAALRDETRFDQ